MARISYGVVVQLIESDPPKVVLLDESSGSEIALSAEAVKNLRTTLDYFAPALGLTT